MDPKALRREITDLLTTFDERTIAASLAPKFVRISKLFGRADNQNRNSDHFLPFLSAYVVAAADNMSCLINIAHHHRMDDLLAHYIRLASGYLQASCDEIRQHPEREDTANYIALLQGAYIAHRMFEDLNDKVQGFLGIPFQHQDMMDANLIVHEVIGDNFANRLDQVTASLIQQSRITKAIIEAQLDKTVIAQLKSEHHAMSGKPVNNFAGEHGLDMLSGLM